MDKMKKDIIDTIFKLLEDIKIAYAESDEIKEKNKYQDNFWRVKDEKSITEPIIRLFLYYEKGINDVRKVEIRKGGFSYYRKGDKTEYYVIDNFELLIWTTKLTFKVNRNE